MKSNTLLRGIIVPLVTPLADRDALDVAGLERLIAHVLAGGVHGLFVLGTTGEAPSLGYRLRHELIRRTCRQVDGRVPVVVGVSDSAFVETVNLANVAADAGAQAVVLTPPYYFPAGQAELLEYLQHLAAELPLPFFLYNMPSLTKVVIEPPTVRQALDIPGLAGIKDSSGDMVYFHRLRRLLRDRPDLSLLVGPEELLAETVMLGGQGGVNGGANLFPELFVNLYNAAIAGNRDRAQWLHEQVMEISDTIYRTGSFGSSFLKGLKCALSIEGICNDFMAEPFHRFRAQERSRIAAHLNRIKPQVTV